MQPVKHKRHNIFIVLNICSLITACGQQKCSKIKEDSKNKKILRIQSSNLYN